MREYEIYCDGGCTNNGRENAKGCVGIVIYEDGRKIREIALPLKGKVTNNIAEWKALYYSIRIARFLRRRYPFCSITIKSDSLLVVKQFNGEYSVNDPDLRKIYFLAKKYAPKMIEVIYISRKFNKEADSLTKRCISY